MSNDRSKFYSLSMFPYPSGTAMHVGHVSNFLVNEIVARYQRMKGSDVIYPLGYDSFGLPTENFAIKNNKSARQATEENIKYFEEQIKAIDFSFDTDRTFKTSDPEYYKWTQWIFAKLFEHGLVYRKDGFVNRCNGCQTVLANDQVVDGRCERCETEIIQKKHPQRYIKITDYADQLLDYADCDRPEETKTHQTNWIGKSQGTEIDFVVEGSDQIITVFTTRPDTVYGVTAIVLAPENDIIDQYMSADKQSELSNYRKTTALKTTIERQATDKDKTGFDSGVQVTHPLTGELVPVWFADYVLPDYATGAVMFVPAHDERDWEFAQKYELSVQDVIAQHYISGNPPVEGKPQTIRNNVLALLFDEEMKTILCLERKKMTWRSFVMGGVEDGEDRIEAGRREIMEESGYDDIEYIQTIPGEIHAEYFAAHKDVNRYSFERCLVYRLKSRSHTGIIQDEDNHDLQWISIDQLDSYLEQVPGEYNSNLIFWKRYVSKNQAYTGTGKLINSGQFNGLDNIEAKKAITSHLESIGKGRTKITYRLRDWSVSRQRYWGSPIPVYYTFAENEKVPYFKYNDSIWGVKEGSDIRVRTVAQAIIKDINSDKYLVLKWKVDGTLGFVIGGVEDGESFEHSIIREISEEAGFDDVKIISQIGNETHRHFYHALKGHNQYAKCYTYYVEVDASKQRIIDKKELEKHEPIWLTKQEILDGNADPDMIYEFSKLENSDHNAERYTDRYNAYNPHPDKTKWTPHLIPESDLPVILPLDLPNYKPAGKSPLEDHPHFKYYHAPDGQVYLRECDTLDTFMCSSFYFLRFCDPHNTEQLISPQAAKLMPVDLYVGGKEHTVGHLLYSRFIYKFLQEHGYVACESKEPFHKLVHQGMVHASDGRKMSKRWGNIIDPMTIINEYGSDTLRTYTMFMGPVEASKNWNPDAVAGVYRFLGRVERLKDKISNTPDTPELLSTLHQTIRGITQDIGSLKLNTAVSKLMIMLNAFSDEQHISLTSYLVFLKLLAPFATKITQQLRQELAQQGSIHTSDRPLRDEALIVATTIDLPVQINGKMRGTIAIIPGSSQDEVMDLITNHETLSKWLIGEIIKTIYVQDKICNIIVK